MADVESRELEWLWEGRIPLGKLSLLAGDPGVGKSFVTLDMASRVSRGKVWPDGAKQKAGSVIIIASEDDAEDTIKPRLERANADLSKIHIVDCIEVGDTARSFTLDADLPLLHEMVEDLGDVRLLIIDPMAAHCGGIDCHKNADVRGMLTPLIRLAAEARFAIGGIEHLSKPGRGKTKAIYRPMGSLAFAAAARAVWGFYEDAKGERAVMLSVKLNLAKKPDGMSYTIEDGGVRWGADPILITADEMQELEMTRHPTQSSQADAAEFLRELLANGSVASQTVLDDAKSNGITESTLRRAFRKIGGKPVKAGMGGGWNWSLPEDGHLGSENLSEDGQSPGTLI